MAFISILRAPTFRYRLALLSLLSIIIGIFASRAMMSIGMVAIGAQFFLKPGIGTTFRYFIKDKKLLYPSLVFLLYMVSGLYSTDMGYYSEKVVLKIPFLFMPLGFAALEDMPPKYFIQALSAFVMVAFFATLWSIGNYLLHFAAITESYKHAKVIPVLFNMNHIRFSLMLALAILSAYYLYAKRFFIFNEKVERSLFLGSGIVLFIFLHILSVRSGLLAFYASLFIVILAYIFQQKKYKNGIFLLLLLIVTPLVMYAVVPTIRNKVDYMILDISLFMKGKGANTYSDSNRLLSIKIGVELGNKNPLIGVGLGDVENEMFSAYKTDYPYVVKDRRLIPHNQFIYVYMAVGGLGLLLFSYLILYPFFSKSSYVGFLFISLNTIFVSSYLSEATLENQLGVCLFITFYLLTYFIDKEVKLKNT